MMLSFINLLASPEIKIEYEVLLSRGTEKTPLGLRKRFSIKREDLQRL